MFICAEQTAKVEAVSQQEATLLTTAKSSSKELY